MRFHWVEFQWHRDEDSIIQIGACSFHVFYSPVKQRELGCYFVCSDGFVVAWFGIAMSIKRCSSEGGLVILVGHYYFVSYDWPHVVSVKLSRLWEQRMIWCHARLLKLAAQLMWGIMLTFEYISSTGLKVKIWGRLRWWGCEHRVVNLCELLRYWSMDHFGRWALGTRLTALYQADHCSIQKSGRGLNTWYAAAWR